MSRSYSSGGTGDSALGNRWLNGDADRYLVQSGSNIAFLVGANSQRVFTGSGSPLTYTAPADSNLKLTHDSVADEYILTDTISNIRYTFHDFTIASSYQRGKLKEISSRQWNSQGKAGLEYSYDTYGQVTQIMTAEGQDYSIVFTYNNWVITKIEVKDGTTVLQQVEYTYYGDVTSPSTDIGSSGDLVQVKVSRDASNDTPGTLSIVRYTQYRYDSSSRLKAVYDHDAIQRIISSDAGISSPADILSENDDYGTPDLETFAGHRFTYYASNTATSNIATPFDGMGENLNTLYGGAEASEAGFAKSETIGAGCSSCGSSNAGLTKTYFYLFIDQGVPSDQNEVTRLVIEDTEDADGTAVYRTIWGLNEEGRQLRKVFIDDPTGSPTYWCESWTLTTSGKEGRVAEYRLPSAHAVTSASALRNYLDPYDDVAPSWSNDTNTLNSSDGLINVYTYNSAGSRTDHKVKKGRTGTEYYVGAWDYGDGDGDSTGDDYDNNTLLVATYAYPTKTTTRADGKKTSYSYTFWDTDDSEVKTKTTTLPVISTGQNGSGVATTMVEYYGDLGNLRWTQDGEGYVNYYSYNPVTGGGAYVSIDVDPASPGSDVTSGSVGNWDAWTVGSASTNKPTRSGSLPTALDLVTKAYYDDQGRQIRTVEDGGAEHYTVYEDLRTISFPYWDSANSKTLMPIQISKLNNGGQIEQLISVKAGYTSISTASSAPTGFSTEPSQSDYVSWTRINRSDTTGRLESVDRYHDIPSSGDGTLSTNYYHTISQYDAMSRIEYMIQVVSGSSATDRKEQVTQNVYDIRDRVIETKMGVSGDSASGSHNMTDDYDTYPTLRTTSKAEYDGGGIGDGYVTKNTWFFGTGTNDYTGVNYELTYRGHLRGLERFYMNGSTETPFGPYTVTDVDWQGRSTATAVYDTAPTWATVLTGDGYTAYASSTSTDRRTLNETYFDDLGRAYQMRQFKISASTGTGSDYMLTDAYYDRNNRLVAIAPAYAAATEKAYDGAGRNYQTRVVLDLESTKFSSGAFQYRDPVPKPTLSSMSGGDDYVLTLNHTTYDVNNAIEQYGFEDNHDDTTAASGRGIDLSNNDDYVRRSVYSWYDNVDRLETTADYGSGDTTAGAGTWKYAAVPTRPGTAPTASSDTKLVTLYGYDADTGRQDVITDPAGTDTKTFFDDLGRTTYVAENYDDFNASTEANTGDSTDKSQDRVTKFTYNGLNGRVTLVAMDANADGTLSDNQTTIYLFEDAVQASLATNEIYPDSSDTTSAGSDQVKFEFNTDGGQSKRTDQRGTVLDYTYTNERRLDLMKVTTLGGSTDGHVRSIARSYDDMGRVETLTSYANSDGTGTVRNEIQYEYNDLDQMAKTYQSHEGAVNTGTTLNVQYGYDATVSSNVFSRQHRKDTVTYPDGRVIFIGYDAGSPLKPASRLSRVHVLRETNSSGTILSKYDYNGTGRLALVDLPSPDIKLDYFQDSSGTYAGYDRFGRIIDQYWKGYGATADVDRFKYAYDYAGSRMYRDIDSAIYASNDKDQAYTYDGLDRLMTFDEGTLSGSTISGTSALEEDWTLDALGNWPNYLTKTSGTTDLDQDRTSNAVNEITDITETTGPSWATPAHDTAGNMTSIPQPAALTSTYAATYDAWNRLVKLEDGANTVAEYEYDGRNQRIIKSIYASGSLDHRQHVYYNNDWQALEVRKEVSGTMDADPLEQYVWHPYYIDAILLRDYDADVNGSSTRYFYCQDANFNVTALTNEVGVVVERYQYSPYGELTVLDADFSADANSVSDVDNDVTFTGRRYDAESGLYYYRNRMYHSHMGRFVSRDPILYDGSKWNLYEYVRGNPLTGVDPSGKILPVIIFGVEVGCCAGCAVWLTSTAEACWNGPCANAKNKKNCVKRCVDRAYNALGPFDKGVLTSECGLCVVAALKKAIDLGVAGSKWCIENPVECRALIDILSKFPW